MKRLGWTEAVVGQFVISPDAKTCKAYPLEVDLYSAEGLFLRKETLTVFAVGPKGCYPIPRNE